jgi:hypothetical protein
MARKSDKYEKNISEHRDTVKKLQEKCEMYQTHVEKLTKEAFIVSEIKKKYDDAIRDNEMMRHQIRFIEKSGGMQRISIGMGRPSTTTHLNGASLGMEDEAGEEFNNTYLNDLKNGGSEMSLDLYSTKELQKRNSMYPQHLRGSYAVIGMDRTVGEQEMKVNSTLKPFTID